MATEIHNKDVIPITLIVLSFPLDIFPQQFNQFDIISKIVTLKITHNQSCVIFNDFCERVVNRIDYTRLLRERNKLSSQHLVDTFNWLCILVNDTLS